MGESQAGDEENESEGKLHGQSCDKLSPMLALLLFMRILCYSETFKMINICCK